MLLKGLTLRLVRAKNYRGGGGRGGAWGGGEYLEYFSSYEHFSKPIRRTPTWV